jgi:hypothetical protein
MEGVLKKGFYIEVFKSIAVREVLMKMKKIWIAIVAIWVAAAIAIYEIWIWGTTSPTLETLVTVDISIGIATLVALFTVTLWVGDKIRDIGEKITISAKEITNALKKGPP